MRIDFSDINNKVKLYLSVGRYEAAEKLIEASIDEFGSLANLHNLLGFVLHKQSKFVEAIAQFSKALKINPSFLEAGLNLSVIYCDLGRYDEGRKIFQELTKNHSSVKKQPDLVLGRLANQHAECGKLYEETGLLMEALTEYKKALTLYDRLPDVKLAVGRVFFKLANFDRAFQEFQDMTQAFPEESESHLWTGICALKIGRLDIAATHWKIANQLSGGHGIASTYLKALQN